METVHSFLSFFEPTTLSGDSPDMILFALRALNISDPSRVLFIGDADADTIAAQQFALF